MSYKSYLNNFLFLFSHSYTGQDYSTLGSAGKISLDQIDSVSILNLDLCQWRKHRFSSTKDYFGVRILGENIIPLSANHFKEILFAIKRIF